MGDLELFYMLFAVEGGIRGHPQQVFGRDGERRVITGRNGNLVDPAGEAIQDDRDRDRGCPVGGTGG